MEYIICHMDHSCFRFTEHIDMNIWPWLIFSVRMIEIKSSIWNQNDLNQFYHLYHSSFSSTPKAGVRLWSGLGQTKKLAWHKILRTQTKIDQTQLVRTNVRSTRNWSGFMSDQLFLVWPRMLFAQLCWRHMHINDHMIPFHFWSRFDVKGWIFVEVIGLSISLIVTPSLF